MSETKSQMRQRIEWRREKVQELSVKGHSQANIARILNIDKSAISRDIEYLREEARESIKNHIEKTLPHEYSLCIQGLNQIITEAWDISAKAEKEGDTKEKLQSLSLIKDTYSTKMELLTNASLLQDSIKFVEQTKEKLSSNNKKVNKQDNGLEGFTETNITESTEPVF